MTAPDIFLSYNREDQAVAKRYADVCSPNFTPKSGHSAFHPTSVVPGRSPVGTKRVIHHWVAAHRQTDALIQGPRILALNRRLAIERGTPQVPVGRQGRLDI